MVPFDFENILINKFDHEVHKTEYFQSIEYLQGKSISDLFLKNPTVINQALQVP